MRKTVDRTVSRFYTVERQFSCEAIQLTVGKLNSADAELNLPLRAS